MEKIINHAQMLENLPMVVMRLFYENGIWKTWYVSKDVEKYGYSRDEFMNGSLTWNNILHPDDRVAAAKLADDYVKRNLDDFRLQYRVVTRKGESIWITEYSHTNRNPDGSIQCVDSVLLNTTEAKMDANKAQEHVRQQAVMNDILLSLHDSNLEMALQIILDRTGAYLNSSRALLFKDSQDHMTCKVVYEWLNKGITSIKDLDYAVTYSTEMPEIYVALRNTGLLIVNSGEIPENCQEEFEKEGLVASAIFAVYLHGDHYGFVCFDDCVIERQWSEDTVNFLKNITSLISTVLMRMHTEKQLQISQRTCETVLDNIDSYIFAANHITNEIVFANRAFRNVFGPECLGKKTDLYIRPSGGGAKQSAPNGEQFTFEAHLDRTGQWLSVTRELVPWVDGQTVYLVNCHDITAQKRYEDNITRLAFQDHLTGLPNRYRCDVDLQNSIDGSMLTGQTGYLFFIDLDDFKVVNDSYGHEYGDGVLISFAKYISEMFAGDNRVYRFGGDEFVIVVERASADEARMYLEQMLERARQPWPSLGKEFHCGLSIGVVEFPHHRDDAKSIIKKADIAMYQAKKSGKNSYVFYMEGLDSDTVKRSEMERLIRNALMNDFQGIDVHYQFYSDTASGRVVGAEALVRMRDPDDGLLLPERFLSLAEYLGLIGPIGEHVLATAAAECLAINNSGLKDFTITVNLSPKQFKQQNIVARLEDILVQSGVNLRNVIIAINEGVAIGELDRMLPLCGELRKKGIRVALDDFGSGSASFINMRNLPVDIIKVSSQYIDDIDDQFTGSFLRLVTDLSHFTNKKVCVNGVETISQFHFCKRMGIDMVQGFLLHRPEDITSLKEMLAKGAIQYSWPH